MFTTTYLWQWGLSLGLLLAGLGLLWLVAQRYGPQWRQKLGVSLGVRQQVALDARYRVVELTDTTHRYLLLLGPQQGQVLATTPLANATSTPSRRGRRHGR